MKICLINTLFPPNQIGGAEISVALLAHTIAEAGHQVSVISLHNAREEKTAAWNNVTAYYVPPDNLYWPHGITRKPLWKRLLWHLRDIWNARAAKRVGRILDLEKPDILHSHNLTGFSVAIWAEAKKRNIPIIHTLRDYSLLCPRATMFHNGTSCSARCGACAALSFPKKLASHMVDHVIGVSRFTLDQHLAHGLFKKADASVVYNSINPEQARPPVPADADHIFGFIGSITPEKGIEILLAATRLLPPLGWKLLIAGKGDDLYVSALKKRYPAEQVEWLGFVPAHEFYPRIQTLIVPSLWAEPFGRVIIEAAMQGVPVIASDQGGMPEIMRLGIPGMIVTAGSAVELATVMLQAMQNPASARPAAPSEWKDHFSQDRLLQKHLAHYRNALERRRA